MERHSEMHPRRIRNTVFRLSIAAAAGLMLAPAGARSQYLEPTSYEPSDARFVSAGIFARDFLPVSSNPLDGSAISYHRIMPVIGLRQGPIDATFGYTRYSLDGQTLAAIMFAAAFTAELRLTGTRESALVLLMSLQADYTKSESSGPERASFNIGSIGVGGGLRYRWLGRSFETSVSVSGAAQYSFEGYAVGTGFSPLLLAEAGVVVPQAFSFGGIALGYRLRLQTWSMSDERFNYRSVSHGPYVGLVF